MTPYDVLGVDRSASDDEIRRAYVALARRFHPDVHPGGEERMRAINEAWAVLGDRRRRTEWDRVNPRVEPPDPGFRPHDVTDDGADPRTLADAPYRPVTPRQASRRSVATFVPIGMFVAALATAFWGVFLASGLLIGVGVVLFSVACLAMIALLLTALVDARHDEG